MRRILALLTGAVGTLATMFAIASPASAATAWPAHYSAPYVDVSLYPQFNLTAVPYPLRYIDWGQII